MTLRVCTCGRHVKGLEPTCPFCGVETPSATAPRMIRRSRAALFASVSLVGVACGARTDIGVVRGGDAATEVDASTDAVSLPDVNPTQCVSEGKYCTESSECCQGMMCQAGQCGYIVFYGGPFPDQ